jgi:hypothetical protein
MEIFEFLFESQVIRKLKKPQVHFINDCPFKGHSMLLKTYITPIEEYTPRGPDFLVVTVSELLEKTCLCLIPQEKWQPCKSITGEF